MIDKLETADDRKDGKMTSSPCSSLSSPSSSPARQEHALSLIPLFLRRKTTASYEAGRKAKVTPESQELVPSDIKGNLAGALPSLRCGSNADDVCCGSSCDSKSWDCTATTESDPSFWSSESNSPSRPSSLSRTDAVDDDAQSRGSVSDDSLYCEVTTDDGENDDRLEMGKGETPYNKIVEERSRNGEGGATGSTSPVDVTVTTAFKFGILKRGIDSCGAAQELTEAVVREMTPLDDDPYADVRERMAELAALDRLLHTTSFSRRTKREHENAAINVDHVRIPFFAAITTYLGYVVLILVGHVRDLCASIFRSGRYVARTAPCRPLSHLSDYAAQSDVKNHKSHPQSAKSDYAPLLKSWENFYTRRLYHRIQDCFNRPIASNPGAVVQVLERISVDGNKTMKVLGDGRELDVSVRRQYAEGRFVGYCATFDGMRCNKRFSNMAVLDKTNDGNNEGKRSFDQTHRVQTTKSNITEVVERATDNDGRIVRHCLNLGSYNYLGFADDWNVTCAVPVLSSLRNLPVSCSSSRFEVGTTALHRRVELSVASFLNKEDAIVYNMGFNTNATAIPALIRKRDLLISDELNHTSIVNGARASGASIRTFRHNDDSHLEKIVREAIVLGQPRTRRPWAKIVVIVEGVYSMEGEYCNLRAISNVCKKYGAYLYLDEAHSIGAMGLSGRGCCEYTGVDPADVDLLMGTFTKSFGGMGGYIASSKRVISYLRQSCAGSVYHNSISPVVCQQIITSFEVIVGKDGSNIGKRKLHALRDNSNYFRMRLVDMGLHVLGNYDSPVVPVMLYNPTKIAAFSRECLKRGLAVVVVGFPAVPILMSRARFCISAGHTREQLDRALVEIDEIADVLKLRYARSTFG